MSESDSAHDPTNPKDFREILGRFPTGVSVVTAKAGEHVAGATIGSFVSISLDPPLVGFFLDLKAGSWDIIDEAGSFCVNILGAEQTELSNLMASSNPDKFAGLETREAPVSGAPQLDGVVAVIDCTLNRSELLGDHRLIVGRVEHLDLVTQQASSLVFYKGQYGSFEPLTSS